MKSNTAFDRLILFSLIVFIILTPKAFANVTQVNPKQYEIYYDDGTAESNLAFGAEGQYLAVKFNLSDQLSYPIVIDKIRFVVFYFDRPEKLVIFDSDGKTFLWNSSILEPRSVSFGEWIEVDCGKEVSRDFYIAVYDLSGKPNTYTYIGLDQNSPPGHSYLGPPMGYYSSGNLMIRAVVSEVPIGGRLLDDTFAINFLPTTMFLAPIIALSAYLLLTKRKTRI